MKNSIKKLLDAIDELTSLDSSVSWKEKSSLIIAEAEEKGVNLEEFLSWFPDPQEKP